MVEEGGVDQSLWHGGMGKVIRIHESLAHARKCRNKEDWPMTYQWLESVYFEVDAWLRDSQKKQGIQKLYDDVKETKRLIALELPKSSPSSSSYDATHNCRGLLATWELDLRFALKKFGLDMPDKDAQKYLSGGMVG